MKLQVCTYAIRLPSTAGSRTLSTSLLHLAREWVEQWLICESQVHYAIVHYVWLPTALVWNQHGTRQPTPSCSGAGRLANCIDIAVLSPHARHVQIDEFVRVVSCGILLRSVSLVCASHILLLLFISTASCLANRMDGLGSS